MIIRSVILLASLLGFVFTVTGVRHNPGCIVKKEQEIAWPWFDGKVGVWIEGQESDTVFEILLTNSEGYAESLAITRASAKWSLDLGTDQISFPGIIKEGWAKVWIKVVNGSLILAKTTRTFSEVYLDLPLTRPIEEMKVIGSNVTLDCMDDEYSWAVYEDDVVVPFESGGGPYFLHFFAQEDVRPLLTLSNSRLQIGWDGEKIGITRDSVLGLLPPGVYHTVVLTCTKEDLDLDVNCTFKRKVNELQDILADISFPDWPRSFTLHSQEEQHYLLTISRTKLLLKEPNTVEMEGMRLNGVTEPRNLSTTGAIVLFTIAVVIIVVVVGIKLTPRIKKEWKKRTQEKDRGNIEEAITLMEAPPPSQSYAQFQAAVASNQQNACMVAGYEPESTRVSFRSRFKRSSSSRLKDIAMEVHRRGDKPCLVVINNHFDQDDISPSNDLILKVMKHYEEVTREIFEVALSGQYEGVGGVKGLLINNSLPGTIQDQHGRSLLHYAAFAKGPSRDPLWIPDQVKELARQHYCFTGAVDFAGQNPLHTLARSCSNSDAWLKLAEVLLELGCDSQQTDYQGKTPEDRITDNTELAVLFARERKLSFVDDVSTALLNACEEAEVATAAGLLRHLPPLRLSLIHPEDLLVRAIKEGHRDVMLLLLSAGESPLSGCLTSTTPLETAHTTDDTPAIFPAVLRKVFCDSLTGELSKITGNDDISKTLRTILQEIKKLVLREGFNETIMQKLPKDRILLCEAARLGLSITSQLLSMGGTRLVALHQEEQLFMCAIEATKGHREDILYTLVCDLKTNPYSAIGTEGKISKDFQDALWDRQWQLLMENDKKSEQNLSRELAEILKVEDGEISLSENLKNSIIRNDLFAVLHKLKQDLKIDFKEMKYMELGKQLLLLSVQYNKINMAEYLLFQGVDSSDVTSYSPDMLDSEEEGSDCLRYILDYPQGTKS